MAEPGVMITAIICGTVVILGGMFLLLVWLVSKKKH